MHYFWLGFCLFVFVLFCWGEREVGVNFSHRKTIPMKMLGMRLISFVVSIRDNGRATILHVGELWGTR